MADDSKKQKTASVCWKKGSEALSKENWGYAVEMFGTAVRLVPHNLMFRQSLRGAEHRLYDNNNKGASMSSMRLMGVRGKIKKARMSKKWEKVDEAAEEGLKVNPWDPHLNADLGDACRHLGFGEVAKFAYECSLKADSNNKEINKAFAALLEERGEYSQAATVWERLRKIDPKDSEAAAKIRQLTAEGVLSQGGYEDAGSTRDVMSDVEIAKRLKRDDKEGPGASVETEILHAIRKEPENTDNYLKLASHYKAESKYQESLEYYQKAYDVSGNDINIREPLEDAELLLLEKNLEFAKEAVAKDPSDDNAKKNAAGLAREYVLREIEILSAREERYKSDLRLKFRLANLFMRTGKMKEAIRLFQAASADPRQELPALVSLGECFMAEKRPPLAKRNFLKAIESARFDFNNEPAMFKKCYYYLGRICEEAGETKEAESYYNEVINVDYDYKDTIDRLDKLSAG